MRAWIFFLFVLSRQGFGQRMDGAFEFGQVVFDGGLQDQVVSVEVAMRQVIACVRSESRGCRAGC